MVKQEEISPMTSRSQSPTESPPISPMKSSIPSSSLVASIKNAFVMSAKPVGASVDMEANHAALRALFKTVIQTHDHEYKNHAVELLFRLMNGKKKNIQMAVHAGIIPFLMSFLKNGLMYSENGYLFQDKVVCLLTVILKEDCKYCDLAGRFGIFRVLYNLLEEIVIQEDDFYFVKSSLFVSSILKMYGCLFFLEAEVDVTEKRDLVRFLTTMMCKSVDMEDTTTDTESIDPNENKGQFRKRRRKISQIGVALDIAHVFSAMTEESVNDVDIIYDYQKFMVDNLLQNNYQSDNICPVLRLLGNGIRMSDEIIKYLMKETRFLEKLVLYLDHNPRIENHREVIWILSNISCSREISYFHSMIEMGVFEKLNSLIGNDNIITVDILELIQNVFLFGDVQCKTYLLKLGIENVLCLMMNLKKSIVKFLELLKSVIKFALEIKLYDKFRLRMQKFMDKGTLEEWSFSNDTEVKRNASYILSTLENRSRHLPTQPSPEEIII
jgi:hypothetical protein